MGGAPANVQEARVASPLFLLFIPSPGCLPLGTPAMPHRQHLLRPPPPRRSSPHQSLRDRLPNGVKPTPAHRMGGPLHPSRKCKRRGPSAHTHRPVDIAEVPRFNSTRDSPAATPPLDGVTRPPQPSRGGATARALHARGPPPGPYGACAGVRQYQSQRSMRGGVS